jgi:beta-lactamase class A
MKLNMSSPSARSRRAFLKSAAAAATLGTATAPALNGSTPSCTPDDIVDLFTPLPGNKAMKIVVPRTRNNDGFRAELNASQQLFVASAIKTFVLCEALRQVDSPHIVRTLEEKKLTLDSTVWSLGSPVFDPPNLQGLVSERVTMEAMIMNSDNTATDMMLNLATAAKVRQFIASAGLKRTLIPDTTRAAVAYAFGASNYLTITWDELLEVIKGPLVHPFLNSVETFASSADDFVSYYSRALRGEFFTHRETLNEFRRILTLCDFIYLIPFPLGVSAYAKSGNADFPGFHARSIAGGLFVANRWIFFAFVINWTAETPEDQQTVDRFFSAIHRSLTLVKDSIVGASEE